MPDVFAQSGMIAPSPYRPQPWDIFYLLSRFSFLFFLIHLGIFIFILFDCIKHKRGVIWPIVAFLFPLNILVFVLYLALKGDEGAEYIEEEGIMGQGAKRAYFFIFSFIALGVLFWGIADLVRVILEYNWGGVEVVRSYGRYYSQDSFTRSVALRLASIIVALPIWFFHWYNLSENFPKIEEAIDLRITFKTFRNYLYLISGLTLMVVLIFGIWFVYQILAFLLGASNINVGSFAAPIGYTATALAIFIYHFSVLRGARFKEIETQVLGLVSNQKKDASLSNKTEGIKNDVKYCPKCGNRYISSANFCTSCGTKL